MKKLLLFLFAVLLFAPATFASDCFEDPIYDRDWNGEVTTGMFVRDVACMEGSSVIATVPVGEIVKVIAETDGWYKVQTKSGMTGWSGQWLLTQTNKPFASTESPVAEAKDPLFDIVGHRYEDAVRYLAENEIIEGYPDGSYLPDNPVNRAEFTKIIVGAKLGSEPTSSAAACFPDVNKDAWYASWICYAKGAGIIDGYDDGSFKPGERINLAEASKILVNTLSVDTSSDTGGQWYNVFIRSLQNNSYIPDTFTSVSEQVNRSQMAEMIYRIKEEIKNKPSKTLVAASENHETPDEPSESSDLTCFDDQVPASVDMNELRSQWLSWHNEARANRGIAALSDSTGLDYSSSLWAKSNKSSKDLTHDRPEGQSLTNWFADVGIVFSKKTGTVYGENLGLRTFRCSKSDCTDEAIDTARYIFNAFMAEEGTSYTGHYDNIVEADFIELGLGIAVDSSEEIMYIASQFSFGVDSYPSNMCE